MGHWASNIGYSFSGVADGGMKAIGRCGENPLERRKILRLYIQIHTSIQQRPSSSCFPHS